MRAGVRKLHCAAIGRATDRVGVRLIVSHSLLGEQLTVLTASPQCGRAVQAWAADDCSPVRASSPLADRVAAARAVRLGRSSLSIGEKLEGLLFLALVTP